MTTADQPEQHAPEWTCSCGQTNANADDLLEHMDECADWAGAKRRKQPRKREAKSGRPDAPPL